MQTSCDTLMLTGNMVMKMQTWIPLTSGKGEVLYGFVFHVNVNDSVSVSVVIN